MTASGWTVASSALVTENEDGCSSKSRARILSSSEKAEFLRISALKMVRWWSIESIGGLGMVRTCAVMGDEKSFAVSDSTASVQATIVLRYRMMELRGLLA